MRWGGAGRGRTLTLTHAAHCPSPHRSRGTSRLAEGCAARDMLGRAKAGRGRGVRGGEGGSPDRQAVRKGLGELALLGTLVRSPLVPLLLTAAAAAHCSTGSASREEGDDIIIPTTRGPLFSFLLPSFFLTAFAHRWRAEQLPEANASGEKILCFIPSSYSSIAHLRLLVSDSGGVGALSSIKGPNFIEVVDGTSP